ncbi:MAG: DUF3368 domain-containing protein [Nitrospirota bacterium]
MTGRLISNTGPLIALALIDRLDILQKLFRQVTVPGLVHAELLEGGSSGCGLASYNKASWIEVRHLSKPVEPLLQTILDRGEASVIQLAGEIAADYVLIDERKARKVARDVFGLKVVGTARVLVEAKRNGYIDSVGAALSRMKEGGYYIHDTIVWFALKEAKETAR